MKKKGGRRGKMVPLEFNGGAGDGAQTGQDPIKTNEKDFNFRPQPSSTTQKINKVP
jgi:hypothetical protein